MTIVQLEYLLAVANYGSFSLAADKCFVTQPSLSMQVKNLEEELGVILLDRSKKPVMATEAGLIVIAKAKEAVKAFKCVKEAINDLKGEVSGVLRLGVIPTIAPYLLHKFIPDFVKKHPNVDLQISEMVTSDIISALNHDMLDAAIMAGGTTPGEIIEEDLFNDVFYAYVSPSHPLYERGNIRIEDVDLRNLLLLSDGHCLRSQVVELCQAKNLLPNRCVFESGSLETLMRIVDTTSSMTIISQMAVNFVPQERKSQVKSLAKGATSRKITLAMRRTYVKRSLINLLKEAIVAEQ